MSRKRKVGWTHIDIVKDGGSEFDSLGTVEELTAYNEEDLAQILSRTDGPKKKKRKSRTEQEISDVDIDIKQQSKERTEVKDQEVSNSPTTTSTQSQLKKKKKREKKQTKNLELNRKVKKSVEEPEKNETKLPDTIASDNIQLKENWGDLEIPDEIFRALGEKEFNYPTEIQKQCIPKAIGFKDVVGAAETGSGKTLAFGIPLITNIMKMKKRRMEKTKNTANELYAVIIAPTRELALQINSHLKDVTKYTDVTLCSVVGGLAPEKQQRLLSYHPDIVVATPGRLMKMLSSGNEHLSKISAIRFFVIDECDRMFEKGHFAELTSIIEKMNLKERKVQKMVFSATLSLQQSPKKIFYDELCEKIGLPAKTDVIDLTTKRVTVEQLHQMKVICEDKDKEVYLLHFLLQYPGRTIVFANAIACTDRLTRLLKVLEFKPLQLHAKKQQRQRLGHLDAFRSSKGGLLICTDVAAHGLDIPEVDNIVHFQLPKDPKIYVHRCGRTARASKNGRSLVLNGSEDFEALKNISKLLKENEMERMHTDSLVLNSLKERVTLAKEIERSMYQQKKESSDVAWQQRMSKQMGIDTDAVKPEQTGKKALKKKQAVLKRLMQVNPVREHQKIGMFKKSGTITISGLTL